MSQTSKRDDELLQDLAERNKTSFQRLRRLIRDFRKTIKHDSEDRDDDNSFTSGTLSTT